MSADVEQIAQQIAAGGRDALLARLRPAFERAAAAHADVLQIPPEQLEQMVQDAAERADGLQWRRALAGVATDQLQLDLGEALRHPAVARAQQLLGVPAYEDAFAARGGEEIARPPSAARAAAPEGAAVEAAWPEASAAVETPAPGETAEPAAPGEEIPSWAQPAEPSEEIPSWAQPTDPAETPAAAETAEPAAPSEEIPSWGQAAEPDEEIPSWDQAAEPGEEIPSWGQAAEPGEEVPPWAEPPAPGDAGYGWGETAAGAPPGTDSGADVMEAETSVYGASPYAAPSAGEGSETMEELSGTAEAEHYGDATTDTGSWSAPAPGEAYGVPVEAERAEPAAESAHAELEAEAAHGESAAEPEEDAEAPGAAAGPPPSVHIPAVHLAGIANLAPNEAGLELRFADPGVDIARENNAILGRIAWREITAVEVASPGRLRLRRKDAEAKLVIRTARGDASFRIPDADEATLREQLAPALVRVPKAEPDAD